MARLGTVFGIYPRRTRGTGDLAAELIGAPPRPLAAGYVMYGTSTLLVFTAGRGVDGFTLDGEVGEFLLSNPAIRCPQRGQVYSANLAYRREWGPAPQAYVDHLGQAGYSLRYSGAMVADLHRILLQGGIYLYPPSATRPGGKLRLLYECAPLALIVEQAGGRASTGQGRILDVRVDALHQHVPLIIGSAEDVGECEAFWARRAA